MKYKKKCLCCGKEFETNSPQKLYCDAPVHYIPCPICGKPVPKYDRDFTRKPKCCSSECSHKLRMKNLPKRKCMLCGKEFVPKSGVGLLCPDKHYRKCEVCGKEFEVGRPNRDTRTCSTECQWKLTHRTNFERYGAEYPMQTEIGHKNFYAAMEKKYGKKHALQVKELAQKAMDTNLERYGSPYYCTTQDCVDAQTPQSNIISKTNLRFGHKLELVHIKYKMEKRIETRSFDFELPGKDVVIEIDPSFTHSIVDTLYGGVDKHYHINKTNLAKRYGYQCIHIFDWDDTDKIVDMIKPAKALYARKCTISEISAKDGKEFIAENHLQGNCYGQKIFIGLFFEDTLYQVMSFGKSRYDKKFDSELLRLCTKSGYRIIGGASKLFKYAVSNYELGKIISYCDLAKFSGDVYQKIGMKLLRITPPQEIWSKGNEKVTANLLRQRGYDQLFKTNYGKGTSNDQLMIENGWLPVYDCGQAVYGYEED